MRLSAKHKIADIIALTLGLTIGALAIAAIIAALILFPPAIGMLPPIYFGGGLFLSFMVYGLVRLAGELLNYHSRYKGKRYEILKQDVPTVVGIVAAGVVLGAFGALFWYLPAIAYIIASVSVGITYGALAGGVVGLIAFGIGRAICWASGGDEESTPKPTENSTSNTFTTLGIDKDTKHQATCTLTPTGEPSSVPTIPVESSMPQLIEANQPDFTASPFLTI
jgi:hypothetical protein